MQGSREKQGVIRRPSSNEQCQETEENTRMGKARDMFKKTGDIKGIFHARMGKIKDRSSKDLLITEAEEIKKRWQEHTEEIYKKCLNGPDNHDTVVTHLEPDILEGEVK